MAVRADARLLSAVSAKLNPYEGLKQNELDAAQAATEFQPN